MSQNHERHNRKSTTSTPRWVKVFVIIAITLVLLFVILMLIIPGEHGPGRHILPGDAGGHALPINPEVP